MSIERSSPNQQGASLAQPPQPHFNDTIWDMASQLLPDDGLVESMLLPNVSNAKRDVNVALTIDAWEGPVRSLSQHLP
jgi:hypothetical protein